MICSPQSALLQRMRIAIDVEPVGFQNTGTGRMARELVLAMVNSHRGHSYTLYYSGRPGGESRIMSAFSSVPRVSLKRLPFSPKVLYMSWIVCRRPRLERLIGPHDIYYSFVAQPFSAGGGVSSVTIHDLAVFNLPGAHSLKHKVITRSQIRASLKRIPLIITPSEFTKGELVGSLGIEASRVAVIANGVSACFRRLPDGAATCSSKSRFDLPEHYIFYCGMLDRRKNIVRLVRAFRGAMGSLGPDYWLVLMGHPGYRYDEILREVNQPDVNHRIRIIPGPISDDVLVDLYRCAKLFAFPSLYEGFGIPPLEAMACGTPVVCSNTTAVAEVVGDAALTVDPTDVSSLSRALIDGCLDTGLRANLQEKGYRRASQFSWKRSAAQLLGLFESTSAVGHGIKS